MLPKGSLYEKMALLLRRRLDIYVVPDSIFEVCNSGIPKHALTNIPSSVLMSSDETFPEMASEYYLGECQTVILEGMYMN